MTCSARVLNLLIFFGSCCMTASTDSAVNFLEKERKSLQDDGVKCSLKKITARKLDLLRLMSQSKDPSDVMMCLLDGLMEKDLQKSERLWSALGSLYEHLGKDRKASVCFKQAEKLSGKVSSHVKDWSFIGPFIIGKMEVDADPMEAFGGIRNVSRTRFVKNMKYFSELLPGGEVQWSHMKQLSPTNGVNIQPSVNWNDLVNSMGSMGILEWQGWVVGEISVHENDLNIKVQCFGVHTVFIEDIPVTGDVYHRDKYWYGVKLNRGLHTVYIRLRTKVKSHFLCKFDALKTSFEILNPDFLPDLVDGRLFGLHISIPVANYHNSKFLKISKVLMTNFDSNTEEVQNEVVVKLIDVGVLIAPGQVYPVVLKLNTKSDSSIILSRCSSPESDWDIKFMFKFTTSAGTSTIPIKLRCRGSRQSFIFTFIDHDGSVQHAAAIQPQQDCPLHICPVMLSLHGTTIPAQNQADSYKHMVNGEFVFGFPHAWTLAPTRHGAHNWEGPGLLTALKAVESLATLTATNRWIQNAADKNRIIYAGHSMGGHGAWHIATHYPDRSLALVSLAGWIKKEEYGDSNLFFRHDVGTSHVSPAVKSLLESCIVENDADQHVSNLHGVPVVLRIGASDRTVHPWFVRRMYRLLKEEGITVNYTEIKDKEHWWWDTVDTNDGGAVNDKYLRDFVNKHVDESLTEYRGGPDECVNGECDEEVLDGSTKYKGTRSTFTLVCYNPALGEGMHGVRVLRQRSPYRKSRIEVTVDNDEVTMTTQNVERFSLSISSNRKIDWWKSNIMIDGAELDITSNEKSLVHLCFSSGIWKVCTDPLHSVTNRGPLTLGPARRIAESTLRIIIGTQGSDTSQTYLLRAAVYIANLFLLTSDARVVILKDSDVQSSEIETTNVLILGNNEENLHTEHFLKHLPVIYSPAGISLVDCMFSEPRTGLLSLAPNGDSHLALLLLGNTMEGLQDVVSLAAPTIPPMTRSPFSNLIPDFIITGPKFGSQGPGGYSCAGFYGNHWEYRPDLASCVCVH